MGKTMVNKTARDQRRHDCNEAKHTEMFVAFMWTYKHKAELEEDSWKRGSWDFLVLPLFRIDLDSSDVFGEIKSVAKCSEKQTWYKQ